VARLGRDLADANRRFDDFVAELHLFNARCEARIAPSEGEAK
jgi:hypothetical protein